MKYFKRNKLSKTNNLNSINDINKRKENLKKLNQIKIKMRILKRKKNLGFTKILQNKIKFKNETDKNKYNIDDDSLIFDEKNCFTQHVEKMIQRNPEQKEITDYLIGVLIIAEEDHIANNISKILSKNKYKKLEIKIFH